MRPSNDICADQIERMIRDAGAVSHAGLVLREHHDRRIAELEGVIRNALRQADMKGMAEWSIFKEMQRTITK